MLSGFIEARRDNPLISSLYNLVRDADSRLLFFSIMIRTCVFCVTRARRPGLSAW